MIAAKPEMEIDLLALRRRRAGGGRMVFTDVDTFEGQPGEPLFLHKYNYGNGNPVSNTDPTGMYSLTSVLVGAGIGGILGALTSGSIAYAQGKAWSEIRTAALWGGFTGLVGGALFPLAGAGLAATGASLGLRGAGLAAVEYYGASFATGAATGFLDALWNGENPLWGAARGGGWGLAFAGVFHFGAKALSSVARTAQAPGTDAERAAVDRVMKQVSDIAQSDRFLAGARLADDAQAQAKFFELLDQMQPALTRGGGSAGYISVKMPDGSIKTTLALALGENAGPTAISHELQHIAREATVLTRNGKSLFLMELNSRSWDPAFWALWAREESITWMRTIMPGG